VVKITVNKPYGNGIVSIEINEDTAQEALDKFQTIMDVLFPKMKTESPNIGTPQIIKPEGIESGIEFGKI